MPDRRLVVARPVVPKTAQRPPLAAGRPGMSSGRLRSWRGRLALLAIILLNCQALTPGGTPPTAAPPPPSPTEVQLSPTPAQAATATATNLPAVTELPTATPTFAPVQIDTYERLEAGVTVQITDGGRYIVIGDSLSYGSTLSGQTTYEDICENRWPFTQQLALDTGVLATTTLDRGDSMKTPFFTQEVRGRLESYCEPPAEDPLSSTAVPGSTTAEWLAEHLSNGVLVESLSVPENRVVLLALGADVYADRIGKPSVEPSQYGLNIGQIIEQLLAWDKVIYLGLMPYVRAGSFIGAAEVAAVNAQIDQFNGQLVELFENNGYTAADGTWVDFGTVILEQDGKKIWFTRLQLGPDLSAIPPEELASFIAKDGLHFLAGGYDRIGTAWAEALRAPTRAEQYIEIP